MKNKNFYDILDLTPSASKEDIKAAYRRLVRIYHPDVNKTKEAEEYFKLLNNAVQTLLDDTKRLQYDTLSGFSGVYNTCDVKTQKQGSGKFEKNDVGLDKKQAEIKQEQAFSGGETRETQQESAFYKNETSKTAKKQDIHETKEAKTRAQSPVIDGKDIETVVKVSKEEAKRGTMRKINVLHTDKCPKCLGRRYFNGMVCALCHGAGEKSEHKIMNVKIPAGIKDGTKMKVKGEGEYGKFGGKNGDLYLLIQIEQKEEQRQEEKSDENILIETSISPWQAALGGEVRVPLDGKFVKIKIPPLTKSGSRFKLRKEALNLQIQGLKAEYTVVVKIDIEKNLSQKELELYEKLRDLDLKTHRG